MEALVSLKAELQRKRQLHQEALAAGLPRHKLQIKGVSGNKGVAERDAKDREKLGEERKAAEKAKSVLEKKAALYDKLQGGVAVLDDDSLNNSFLVNFQKKIVDNVLAEKKKRADKSSSSTSQNESLDDWVEHVDALGRSRQVRRSELPLLLEQDRYLRDEEQTEKPADLETEEGVSALQGQFEDAYRTRQRQRWQQQEEINADKQNLHYQDVMFDEARTHGTGFVPLSGDADERQQQQQLLRDLHAASEVAARHHKREQRAKERGMAQRLAKIKQRKRLKRGLPAADISESLKTPPQSDEEDDTEPRASLVPSEDVPAKRPDAPVREWDVGKQVIGKLVEPADRNLDTFNLKNPLGGSVEMTQELWVDRQRLQREEEFAPPSVYSSAGPSDGRRKYNNGAKRFCDRNTGLEGGSSRLNEEDRMQQKFNHRGQGLQEDIINECTDGYSNVGKKYETSSVYDEVVGTSIRKPQRKGAEIAPPATFDYYAPNSKRRPQSSNVMKNLEDAISKGLKKIKEQT